MTVIWLAEVHNQNLDVIVSDAPFYFQKHSYLDGKGYWWLYLPHFQQIVFSSCHFSFFSRSKMNEVKMRKRDLDFCFSKNIYMHSYKNISVVCKAPWETGNSKNVHSLLV
jgi:hypothetical protein